MKMLWANIKLFFIKPRDLFTTLREVSYLKHTLILLLIIAFSFNLPNIKGLLSKYPDAVLLTVALIGSTIMGAGLLIVGLLLGSVYVLVLCRLFGSKPRFTAIFSALIYCGIPSMISIVFYTLLPVKTYILNIFPIEKLHPFLISALQEVDLFWIWVTAMEIIAVAVIARIQYFKSAVIILSYWVVRSILIYLLGLRLGEIYKGVLPVF